MFFSSIPNCFTNGWKSCKTNYYFVFASKFKPGFSAVFINDIWYRKNHCTAIKYTKDKKRKPVIELTHRISGESNKMLCHCTFLEVQNNIKQTRNKWLWCFYQLLYVPLNCCMYNTLAWHKPKILVIKQLHFIILLPIHMYPHMTTIIWFTTFIMVTTNGQFKGIFILT